jgi:hypothetical protein
MSGKCWAVSLGGCSGKISGEHVFSKAAFASKFIATEGMRKIPPGKSISVRALNANVLCTTHNPKLSELDSESGRLSDALRDHSLSLVPKEAHVKVDGWKVERWLLKCLHGHLASKWVKDLEFLPDPSLVKIVFGEGRLGPDAGLYVVKKPEPRRPPHGGDIQGCAVLHDLRDEACVMGAYIQLQCLGLVIKPTPGDPTLSLRTSPHAIAGFDWSHAELGHRPPWIVLAFRRKGWEAHERARLTVEFAW